MCLVESVCPECEVPVDSQVPRRGFLQAMGAGAAVALAGSAAARSAVAFDEKAPAKRGPEKPAEALIKELHASLSDEQKKTLVLPYNHGKGKLSRHGMFNRPFQQQRIGDVYSKPQQELVDRILHAICNGEEGYRQITRAGKFDSSKSLQGCGAHIFGTPGDDTKFTWMFTGHHLTVRCDGNTEPGAAFGGPMYYGDMVGAAAVLETMQHLGAEDAEFAPAKASPTRSISAFKARASPHTVLSLIVSATAFTASKSPTLAIGKPASITSTRNLSRFFAILTFSSSVIEAPGLCSPSLNVVSKIINLSVMIALNRILLSVKF